MSSAFKYSLSIDLEDVCKQKILLKKLRNMVWIVAQFGNDIELIDGVINLLSEMEDQKEAIVIGSHA